VSTLGYYIATESTKGKNTREELTSAKVRKSQARKNAAVIRSAVVDLKHSNKLDKRIANKMQKLAKREAKRAGLAY
jgi:hypothetical protein